MFSKIAATVILTAFFCATDGRRVQAKQVSTVPEPLKAMATMLMMRDPDGAFNVMPASGRTAKPRAVARATPLVDTPSNVEAATTGSHYRACEPQMMAKKVQQIIKLAINAGKANPSPPIGPALGGAGVNIMMFCKEYNARTQKEMGKIIPVEITVFEDKSFTFVLKTPPTSSLLKKAANIQKGIATPSTLDRKGKKTYHYAGQITKKQLEEIANLKMPDLNCVGIEEAMSVVNGTAKNMGIKIVD